MATGTLPRGLSFNDIKVYEAAGKVSVSIAFTGRLNMLIAATGSADGRCGLWSVTASGSNTLVQKISNTNTGANVSISTTATSISITSNSGTTFKFVCLLGDISITSAS